MDGSPPGSSVLGIVSAIRLEWVAISIAVCSWQFVSTENKQAASAGRAVWGQRRLAQHGEGSGPAVILMPL